MAADDFDFDIPETNRITGLMRELFDDAPAERRRGPARQGTGARKGRGKKRAAGGQRLAAFTVGKFVDGVNWNNAQGFASPLLPANAGTGKRLGTVTLAAFGEGINWRNALDGPQLAVGRAAGGTAGPHSGPPETVDDFFGEMTWE